MNTTWHSEKPPRCYGAICAALVVMSMGQVARRVCKGSAWAYTLRVTPTCWHHDFVIVTAGSDLATLAALCIYCTQRLCHDAVKHPEVSTVQVPLFHRALPNNRPRISVPWTSGKPTALR